MSCGHATRATHEDLNAVAAMLDELELMLRRCYAAAPGMAEAIARRAHVVGELKDHVDARHDLLELQEQQQPVESAV